MKEIKTIKELQSENGTTTYNGVKYTLIQQAYPDGDDFYTALAINELDPKNEEGYQKLYKVTWEVKYDSIEEFEEDVMCDWDNPEEVIETGDVYSLSENSVSPW